MRVRVVVIICLIFSAFVTADNACAKSNPGVNEWYAHGKQLAKGAHAIAKLGENIKEATLHVRASGTSWALRWGVDDEGNYCEARIVVTDDDYSEGVYSHAARISVSQSQNGSVSCIYDGDAAGIIDANGDYNSIKVIYDGIGATLIAGNEEPHVITNVPFGASGNVTIIAETPIKCQRITVEAKYAVAPRYAEFDSLGDLNDYIRASSDSIEGIWEYFDRDIVREKASLGGKYLIATVKAPGRGYDIVYIGGADVNTRQWTPLRIKGRIVPTVFSGDFDLEWIDAYGSVLSDDANASISAENTLLTLRFPMQKSQLRFRRVEF